MLDISQLIRDHQSVIESLVALRPQIDLIANRMAACIQCGGKLLWMGNGGSAADCQHLSAELVGRFVHERRAWSSIALTTDTSILTAVANDYSFDNIFARQVEALCMPEDLVIGISTSGNSRNVLCGLRAAKQIGAFVVALTGCDGGEISKIADASVIIPSRVVARIQEAHILIGHIWCEFMDEFLSEQEKHVQTVRKCC
jgi:D-sedoheptulose 7-phosphate isomerase